MPRFTIAKVIVNLALDKAFDYRIPPQLQACVRIGTRVNVPFGKGGGLRHGYVIGLLHRSEWPNPKSIESVDGEQALITPNLLKIGKWMSSYYCCAREQAILSLLPAVVRGGTMAHKTQKVIRLADDADVPTLLETLAKRAPKQAELIKTLRRRHEMTLALANRISSSAVKALRDSKVVVVTDEVSERDPFADDTILRSSNLELTKEQGVAMGAVRESFAGEKKQTILLFGVTGSGKTEIYLQAIGDCLERGEEAIVLVPEIALTPQTTERFRSRFGDEVSVLHSNLSDGERFDEWFKIAEGRVKIVVGARSAIFAPFSNLGLIVVDEEHETSYKQSDQPPRYSARDLAVMRGHVENTTVILGSATPSLESYYNAQQEKYRLVKLTERVDFQQMPTMEVVDMVAEADAQGRPQIISRRLQAAITEAIDNQEQVILFLNRRGYATHMQCLKCGYTAECPDCSVKFTYHRGINQLICHFCGNARHAPSICPACADPEIRYGGLGTEKIESVVHGIFPGARVSRMDSDTMTRKDSYRQALNAFRAGQVDILIGTQMIAKGLHFPNVTLVGIIFADLSLNIPDFRAGERTFQLLVQVAGRAGRGELPGRVIVQTYTPFHPAIQTALKQDYEAFYKQEIGPREALDFPPFTHVIMIELRGPDEAEVERLMTLIETTLTPELPDDTTLTPPMPSPIAKKRGQYHFQLMLNTHDIVRLTRLLKPVVFSVKMPRDYRLSIDVDPFSIL